jgi:7-cyano-7-deazaguanine synthase
MHLGYYQQMSEGLLLSGGMDSISLAYLFRPKYAFTINYGQKPAQAELRASESVCKALDIIHIPIYIDCSFLGSGDLSDKPSLGMSPSPEWWPFRNQFLITVAGMKAISLNINELLVGSVKNDAFHADGTASFYNSINELMSFQEGKISVRAPAINMSTIDLIQQSRVPISILSWAHSCHKSNYPCGSCRGCLKYIDTMQFFGYD